LDGRSAGDGGGGGEDHDGQPTPGPVLVVVDRCDLSELAPEAFTIGSAGEAGVDRDASAVDDRDAGAAGPQVGPLVR
jgi:hypothetical protein